MRIKAAAGIHHLVWRLAGIPIEMTHHVVQNLWQLMVLRKNAQIAENLLICAKLKDATSIPDPAARVTVKLITRKSWRESIQATGLVVAVARRISRRDVDAFIARAGGAESAKPKTLQNSSPITIPTT
jgi:hypothetical protein